MESNNKQRTSNNIVTRNLNEFSKLTDNVYETVALLSKRANQISIDQKKELHKKIDEFSSSIDTIDEIYENREQIEVVRHFEQMPKPTLIATQEYLDDKVYYRNPAKEDSSIQRLEELENKVLAEENAAAKSKK